MQQSRRPDARPIDRRTLLRVAVTGAAARSGISAILAHAQAPAYPKGTKLHLLQWSHYVPAADTLFERQTAEFTKQAGVETTVEHIDQNGIQPCVTAAVQSGTGFSTSRWSAEPATCSRTSWSLCARLTASGAAGEHPSVGGSGILTHWLAFGPANQPGEQGP